MINKIYNNRTYKFIRNATKIVLLSFKTRKFYNKKNNNLEKNSYFLENLTIKGNLDFNFEVADNLLGNVFSFVHKWEMEKCKEHKFINLDIPIKNCEIDDLEWVYVYHRKNYLLDLGIAFFLTKNEKYAEKTVEIILKWINIYKFNLINFDYSWRKMDISIRVSNWIKVLDLIRESKSLTEETLSKINKSIIFQKKNLEFEFTKKSERSNWGIIELHGLSLMNRYLKNNNIINQSYYKETQRKLEKKIIKCIETQFYRDGIHLEQSPMYQQHVLFCMLDLIKYSKLKDEKILECVKRSCESSIQLMTLTKNQLIKGDSDRTNLEDLILEASIILKDDRYKIKNLKNLRTDQFFKFTETEIENVLGIMEEEKTFIKFEESGNFMMKSKENYLYFSNTPYYKGHCHGDNFHISFGSKNTDFLIDSGRYNYGGKNYNFTCWRELLKSSRSHNTFLIDGEDFFKAKGSWGVEKRPKNLINYSYSNKSFDYILGSHDGYNNKVFREIVNIGSNFWIIIDSIDSRNNHKITQLLHTDPTVEVFIDSNEILLTSKDEKVKIISLVNSNIEIEKSYCSLYYNELFSNKKIKMTNTNNFSIFCIVPMKNNEERVKYKVDSQNNKMCVNFLKNGEIYTVHIDNNISFEKKIDRKWVEKRITSDYKTI